MQFRRPLFSFLLKNSSMDRKQYDPQYHECGIPCRDITVYHIFIVQPLHDFPIEKIIQAFRYQPAHIPGTKEQYAIQKTCFLSMHSHLPPAIKRRITITMHSQPEMENASPPHTPSHRPEIPQWFLQPVLPSCHIWAEKKPPYRTHIKPFQLPMLYAETA